jgi:hypothetical protein
VEDIIAFEEDISTVDGPTCVEITDESKDIEEGQYGIGGGGASPPRIAKPGLVLRESSSTDKGTSK